MNSNPQAGSPANVTGRARVVLTTLGLPTGNPAPRHQVETFITCNGYQGVLRAATYTARRATQEQIRDPWAYTIDVYNGNLARLSYLYLLVHWIESGLRSQLDLYYAGAGGATWHRVPERYLPRDSVTQFLVEHAHLGIKAEYPRQSSATREVVEPEEAADFLERVMFGPLVTMVIYAHRRQPARILVPPEGRLLPSAAESRLRGVKDIRNIVAHNQYVDNRGFEKYEGQLLDVLSVLRFDVAKALSRSEERRTRLVQRKLMELRQESS